MRNHLARHTLTGIDTESRAAICNTCGPVSIRPRGVRKDGSTQWRCGSAWRDHKRYSYSARADRTLSERDYEEKLASQGGVCAICKKPPGRKKLALDHDHATGRTRGLLCDGCNLGLGKFADSPEALEAAAEYLRAHKITS